MDKEELHDVSVENMIPELNLTATIIPKSEKKEEPMTEKNSSK